MNKIREIERVLKALGNARRLAITKYLHEQAQASVGEMAEHIHLSFKSTSRHLSILANAEIVEREQISVNVFYRLAQPLSPVLKQVLHSLIRTN